MPVEITVFKVRMPLRSTFIGSFFALNYSYFAELSKERSLLLRRNRLETQSHCGLILLKTAAVKGADDPAVQLSVFNTDSDTRTTHFISFLLPFKIYFEMKVVLENKCEILYLSFHLFSSLSHWLELSELEYKRLCKLPPKKLLVIARLSSKLCLKNT